MVSHGWYMLPPTRWSERERVLRRAEVLGGRAVDLEITHQDGTLQIRGARDSRELRAKIGRTFQLGLDLSDFHDRARQSPAHDWVADAGFGRLLCGSTLFEDVVKIITTTNTMWRQTIRMNELLVEKYGRRTRSGAHAFPLPEDVAKVSEEEIQEECRLGYRAKSVARLARGMADGSLDVAKISDPSQSTDELFKSYLTLPGIGPYGAAHLLAMDGRHDFIAVDTEFRRFVRETYHKGRNVSDAAMLRRYAKWGRWKYLAYWSELWRSVAERLQPKDGGVK
ncbi:MAG TPA: endonuclease III domain-containing protein [Thermoanaerobaculia bacterium]